MAQNSWQKFLKKHGGKGYSRDELSSMYERSRRVKSPKKAHSPKRSRRSIHKRSIKTRSPLERECIQRVRSKISINMKEYKEGRFTSPKQAIAVSYSQVRKSSPKCARYIRK
jgi:hypothetical protein